MSNVNGGVQSKRGKGRQGGVQRENQENKETRGKEKIGTETNIRRKMLYHIIQPTTSVLKQTSSQERKMLYSVSSTSRY